jgi:hypothetical protein
MSDLYSKVKSALTYDKDTGDFFKIKSGIKEKFNNKPVNGYLVIQIDNKKYKLHRLAFLLVNRKLPNVVDHINGNTLDNRWCNIRDCNMKENNRNASRRKDNKSGISGVIWHKKFNKWQAQIKVNRKDIHLGLFLDKFDAICKRKSAENFYGFHPNHGRDCNFTNQQVEELK